MPDHILTGFGFGPIQSGLFACEAFRSGAFARIVIAEIDPALVDAVRGGGGAFSVNIARRDGIEAVRVEGVEIYNPLVAEDRAALVEALRQSTEIVTALPSVAFFERGEASPAALIAEAQAGSAAPGVLIYTAENNNRAAEILEDAVARRLGRPAGERAQFLNTVIGKMSRVVDDPAEIAEKRLAPLAPGVARAHLVEAFNRILVTRCRIPGFRPGITDFIEKDDLLPFEEAKLYGHNAIHAMMGFFGALRGWQSMADLARDPQIMQAAREAFINESGAALIRKHAALNDELFTPEGFRRYAEDLLERITNPYLDDSVERSMRDPLRKLGLNDRIFGTITLALQQGVEPVLFAQAAVAGITLMLRQPEEYKVAEALRLPEWDKPEWLGYVLDWIWGGQQSPERPRIMQLMMSVAGEDLPRPGK